jgi:GNAT superfamily N-acetyltransferase
MTEWRTDAGYVVTTDRARVDLDVVHDFLATSYWAASRSREEQAVVNDASRCYTVLSREGAAVGFARAVTDGLTFAWVADVFVLADHRGRGLATFLMRCVVEDLGAVRRITLATRDAHGVYEKAGFAALVSPERWMERFAQR